MKRLNKNENGFTIVEILLVILTLAMIGVGGFFVAKHVDKTKTITPVTTTTVPVANPYAGWKDYCDTAAKLCFKYPSSWTLTNQNNPTFGTAQTVINSSSTADVQYGNLLASAGEPTSIFTTNPLSTIPPPANTTIDISSTYAFYTSSIVNASSGSNYKIIGGYILGSSDNIPSFFIVNTSTVARLSFKVGQVSKLQNSAFNISDSLQPTSIIIFGGGPITNYTYSPSQAIAWLSSADGKATQQLLQSFYDE